MLKSFCESLQAPICCALIQTPGDAQRAEPADGFSATSHGFLLPEVLGRKEEIALSIEVSINWD